MIKLKILLNEISNPNAINQNMAWRLPSDSPDEVIDVIHKIVTSIMNDENENNPTPSDWIKVVHRSGFWNIFNKRKRSWDLSFYEPKKMWYYSTKKKPYPSPATNEIISQMIEEWTWNSDI